MSSPLTPSAFVERLLEAEEPVWYRWDRDLPALLSELIDVANRELGAPPLDKSIRGRWSRQGRLRRLLWLLDRLIPQSQGEVFEPLPKYDHALYAWGSRLPANRRHLLINLAPAHGWHDVCLQAWCASCPDDALTTLLDWTEAWKPAQKMGWRAELPYPELEFCARFTDRQLRYQHLCEHLARVCNQTRSSKEDERTLAEAAIHSTLRLALRDAAAQNPCPTEPEPVSGEEWSAWFQRTLETPPFASVTEAAGEFLLRGDRDYQARWVWVHSHGKEDWQHLREMAYSESEPFVFDHLADITPPDQLDVWSRLIQHQTEDHGQLRAFCRWLPPEFTHVLQSHFSHPETDWAACAYQCHLAKSPESVLHWEWVRRCEIPAWQVKLLDRRLFAPEPLRPRPHVEDIQDAENDFRLREPFSRRGI